jgi:hypothetical protein
MLEICDRRGECDDGKHRMRVGGRIVGVTIHMYGVPGVGDAAGIARWYRAHPRWTGGQMPYTYVIDASGRVEQALDLYEVGPHARRWSSPTVGIAHIGDFNLTAPAELQVATSALLVSELCLSLGLDPAGMRDGVHVVAGHTERPGGTRAAKQCPGRRWDMSAYRQRVAVTIRDAAAVRLTAAQCV